MNWSVSPLVIWVFLAIVAAPPAIWAGSSLVMWAERRYGSGSDPFIGH